MQESRIEQHTDVLKVLKDGWRQFLIDRDWDAIKSMTIRFESIQQPLDIGETDGWLWFTRAAYSRFSKGFPDDEWVTLAHKAADCGSIIAAEWLANACLFKGKSAVSADIFRESVNAVFCSPLRLGARKLAENVIWSNTTKGFEGFFDQDSVNEAYEIFDKGYPLPLWKIGGFEVNPLMISKTTLISLRDIVIAAWTFNISNKTPVEIGYCSILRLNQDDHLVIFVYDGHLTIKKENDAGSIPLCRWARMDTEPVRFIAMIVDWIDASPAEVWPMMDLALAPSIEPIPLEPIFEVDFRAPGDSGSTNLPTSP